MLRLRASRNRFVLRSSEFRTSAELNSIGRGGGACFGGCGEVAAVVDVVDVMLLVSDIALLGCGEMIWADPFRDGDSEAG